MFHKGTGHCNTRSFTVEKQDVTKGVCGVIQFQSKQMPRRARALQTPTLQYWEQTASDTRRDCREMSKRKQFCGNGDRLSESNLDCHLVLT